MLATGASPWNEIRFGGSPVGAEQTRICAVPTLSCSAPYPARTVAAEQTRICAAPTLARWKFYHVLTLVAKVVSPLRS